MTTNKKKIFNDPVYGFITIPYEIIFDLIEEPCFQRLRRIKQLGLTHFVYPGALHTRFHHALGAMHLMTEAIKVLQSKGVEITEKEAESVTIAILLHDIGHGPFSHALENVLIDIHHEEISLMLMNRLNKKYNNRLSTAIEIFKNQYPKKFLNQLVSGQLDMDRMDYLNRDSFFTGVSEGVIGYDRIIKMLNVYNGDLVVEEKGLYSIEKFLVARRIMYWQVYLHKTVISSEQMLIKVMGRAKQLAKEGCLLKVSKGLEFFLYSNLENAKDVNVILNNFVLLDDCDIVSALKEFKDHSDFTLSYLATCLINRRLFKIEMNNIQYNSDYVEKIRLKVINFFGKKNLPIDFFVLSGFESNKNYSKTKEIEILSKSNIVSPLSEKSGNGIGPSTVTKYYVCYPKET